MNRMKILLSAVLVFAATASIAQDFSDPRYAPWGDTPEQRKQNILTSNLLKEATGIAKVEVIDPASPSDAIWNVRLSNPESATVQRLSTTNGNDNNRMSDRFIEDGSYLRIKNISLGYSFPKKWINKWKIENLKIYMNIQNAFTFTKYKGYDPEIGAYNYNVLLRGVDYTRYPSQRIYTFGLNLSF